MKKDKKAAVTIIAGIAAILLMLAVLVTATVFAEEEQSQSVNVSAEKILEVEEKSL